MPRKDGSDSIHLIGGRVGNAWLPEVFRSLGYSIWYPYSEERQEILAARALQGSDLPREGWQFEDGERPRIVHRPSGETLIHAGADADFGMSSTHWFLYEGALGQYRLPVVFRLLTLSEPQPRYWEIDYRPLLEVRSGSARGRGWPEVRGEARISESEWHGSLRGRCAVAGPARLQPETGHAGGCLCGYARAQGNNLLIGGPGEDTLTGGTGTDLMFGGGGKDTFILGQGGSNWVDGGSGFDTAKYQTSDPLTVTVA